MGEVNLSAHRRYIVEEELTAVSSGEQWRGGLGIFSVAGVRRQNDAVFFFERARSACKGEGSERVREEVVRLGEGKGPLGAYL